MSGRVTDIDANPENPTGILRGLCFWWIVVHQKNGTTFPIFDREAVMTIGDIYVDWKQNHFHRNWRKQFFSFFLCRNGRL